MIYAEIAINNNARTGFIYHISRDLEEKIQPGHMVRVSIRTAQEAGIVVRLTEEAPDFKTKPVLEILDPQPVLTRTQLELHTANLKRVMI